MARLGGIFCQYLSHWQLGCIISSTNIFWSNWFYCDKNQKIGRDMKSVFPRHHLSSQLQNHASWKLVMQNPETVIPKCGVYYQYKWKYILYHPLLSELLAVLCQIQLLIPQCISICEWEVYIYICVHFLHFLHVTIMFFLSHGSVRWPFF